MSDKDRLTLNHPFVFHGKKTVTNESVQITGLPYIGWMHVYANTNPLYIGGSGVADNGLPLTSGASFPILSSSLNSYFVSGSGSISFLGGYSK